MLTHTRSGAIAVLACVLAFAAPAAADSIDQSFTNPSDVAQVISCGSICGIGFGQSFTAGLTGTLSGININLFNIFYGGPVVPIEIVMLDLSGGINSPVVLGSTTIVPQSGQIPIALLITFPQSIAILAGNVYGIGVVAGADTSFDWSGDADGGYAGGFGFFFEPGFPAGNFPLGNGGFDFNFQTHVNPVPEPGTLTLLATGLAGLIGVRRKVL